MALDFRGQHADLLADESPEIDAEGGRNSGKTWCCAAKIIRSCLRYPGIEWLICRYSNEETKTKLRPEFLRVCHLEGVRTEWNASESCYEFPAVDGKTSKVFAYGLKTQDKLAHYAKIRGLGIAGVWNDQTEELPADIGRELRAVLRQQGFPHQLIFSPNPPNEDHWLADEFPEDNHLPGRTYYRFSLYDNAHNLPEHTIIQLEQAYPLVHAKHKSLILGQRGPNIVGTPVYEHAFARERHVLPLEIDGTRPIIEALFAGQHNPVWLTAQRMASGALHLLGGMMGKRLFLDDFLPIVEATRAAWYPGATFQTCCDPPLSDTAEANRFSNIATIRSAGFKPRWRDNASAPDVREATIQEIASMMGREGGFVINADPSRWLMASLITTKESKQLVDGCEGSYVWDEHFISVGNKKVRQPKTDEWMDGWQRCLENLTLNFCADQLSDDEKAARKARTRSRAVQQAPPTAGPIGWMAQ